MMRDETEVVEFALLDAAWSDNNQRRRCKIAVVFFDTIIPTHLETGWNQQKSSPCCVP